MSGGEHYFTRTPLSESHPATAVLRLPDRRLQLITDRGVFAHGHIDRGTELLLKTIPAPPAGDLIDVGCGYGAIAIAVALRAPRSRVWAVDVNERALTLCERNAAAGAATNVITARPEDVPESTRFAAVYSNPPVRVGKKPLHDLLAAWLDRLTAEGHAYLVVQRNLGSDSLARWLTERGYDVERLRSRAGYRVLDVRRVLGEPS
jgi:16S rRNA (guanine1207-N2)-methyltransferase